MTAKEESKKQAAALVLVARCGFRMCMVNPKQKRLKVRAKLNGDKAAVCCCSVDSLSITRDRTR